MSNTINNTDTLSEIQRLQAENAILQHDVDYFMAASEEDWHENQILKKQVPAVNDSAMNDRA